MKPTSVGFINHWKKPAMILQSLMKPTEVGFIYSRQAAQKMDTADSDPKLRHEARESPF